MRKLSLGDNVNFDIGAYPHFIEGGKPNTLGPTLMLSYLLRMFLSQYRLQACSAFSLYEVPE